MTTKQILFLTLIFSATNSIALAMDNKNIEEANFQANIGKLKQPLADFVMDFKTWPKEEQNKIKTYRLKNSQGYHIDSDLAVPDKYNTQYGLGYYLDCRLTQQQITLFLDAIDYLKKQQ